MPPQVLARSPGWLSTCLLQRQNGQWLVYPLPLTFFLQLPQMKFSVVLLNVVDMNLV